VLELLEQLSSHATPYLRARPTPPPRLHKFASFSKMPDQWDALLGASLSKISDSLVSIPRASGGLSGTPEIHRCYGSKEGQEFILTRDEGTSGSIISAIHTPGHTHDSICLSTRITRSSHSILSWAMEQPCFRNFLSTSRPCSISSDLNARGDTAFTKLYPGHGPVAEGGETLIQQYIAQRLAREELLVTLLVSRGDVEDKSWTADRRWRRCTHHMYGP